MVRLLISEGSWLVLRMAENATLPVPDLTDMPRALPDGSADGVESHTTRHFPSNTIGSVSFWQLTLEGPQCRTSSSPMKNAKRGVRYGNEEGGDGQGIAPNDSKLWMLLAFAGVLSPNSVTIWPLQILSERLSFRVRVTLATPSSFYLKPRDSCISSDLYNP